MLDARRCHYHAGKSASRGNRVAAQARHARRGARDTRKYTRPAEYSTDIVVRGTRFQVTLLTPVITSRRLRTTTTATYIFLGCVFRIICFLHLPPSATCARRHLDGNPPRRSHQTQPTSGAQIGVSSRGRGDITQARGGGAPPRRRGAPPPAMRQRSLLRVRISQTSSAPCNEPRASPPPRPLSLVACPPMAALSGLSTDLGIPPSEVAPQRASSKRAQPD